MYQVESHGFILQDSHPVFYVIMISTYMASYSLQITFPSIIAFDLHTIMCKHNLYLADEEIRHHKGRSFRVP